MKGGSFEIEVASILSLWWSDGENDNIFYRSQSSGARATRRNKIGKETKFQHGDISPSDKEGEKLLSHWHIECKTGYGGKEKIKDANGNVVKSIQYRWDILDLIDSSQKQTVFEMMWEQCCRDANLSSREPVLIFRRNQRKICVAITSDYLRNLVSFYGSPPCKRIRYDWEDFHIFMMPFKEFLVWLHDPEIYF